MSMRIGDSPTAMQSPGAVSRTERVGGTASQGVSSSSEAGLPEAGGGNALVAALAAFLPTVSGNVESRLAEITAKLREVSGEVQKDRVLNEQEAKRLNLKENAARLEQSQSKLDDAQALKDGGKVFSYVSMAFQAVAAVTLAVAGAVMIGVGVAALATGVGAPVGMALVAVGGGVMIGTAALSVLALVNTAVQTETGAGLVGNIAKAIDPDVDPAVVMGLDIGFAAVLVLGTVAGSVASAIMTGGASSIGTAVSIFNAVTMAMNAITQIGAGVATIGSSSLNIASAIDRHEAGTLDADRQQVDAMMQQLDDIIDAAMQMLLQASERFNMVMDSVTDMMKENADTMSSTRFSACGRPFGTMRGRNRRSQTDIGRAMRRAHPPTRPCRHSRESQ